MAKTSLNSLQQPDRRRLRRNSMHSRDVLTCRIQSFGGEERSFPVLDFNSLGLSLSCEGGGDTWLRRERIKEFAIFFGKAPIAQISDPEKIKPVFADGKSLLLFQNLQSSTPRIRIERIRCLNDHQAQVMVGDLIRREILSFRVENFSSTGMLLSTSPSNRHLMPGMKFEKAQLYIPHLGVSSFDFKIIHCRMEDRIYLGVQYLDGDLNDLLMAYGLICIAPTMSTAEGIYKSIRQQRLNSRKISKAVRIELVSDSRDYQKALEVRLRAYQEAGKLTEGTHVTHMADEYDDHAVIFVAKVGGVVLGTARIVLGPGSFPMDHYFPSFNRKKFRGAECEISRLAIDPAWQRTDLLTSLFKACFEYIAQNDIENVYCVSTDRLKDLYLKLGAHTLASGARHPVLTDETMNLMLIKKREYIKCQKMTAHAWERVAEEVIDHLSRYGFIAEKVNRPQIVIRKIFERFILKLLPKRRGKNHEKR